MRKNILLTIVIFMVVFTTKAQIKIYDFPFDNSYNATVGTAFFDNFNGTSFTTDRKGITNKALYSTVNGAYSFLNYIPSGNSSRTFSLWFNRLDSFSFDLLLYGQDRTNKNFNMYFDGNGTLLFDGDGNPVHSPIISVVPLNTWHHLAVTYDGDSVRIYLNSNLINKVGKELNTLRSNFALGAGYFDDFKVYEGALTALQVQEVFANNDLTSGISEINNKKITTVYPNPVKSILNVEVNEIGYIKIVNVLGVTVATQKLNEGNNKIDVNNLANGIYFISDEKGGVAKFVKD